MNRLQSTGAAIPVQTIEQLSETLTRRPTSEQTEQHRQQADQCQPANQCADQCADKYADQRKRPVQETEEQNLSGLNSVEQRSEIKHAAANQYREKIAHLVGHVDLLSEHPFVGPKIGQLVQRQAVQKVAPWS